VQATRLAAVARQVLDGADPGTCRHDLPDAHRRHHRQIGRAEGSVDDRDDAAACQIPGIPDPPGTGGVHGLSRPGGEVDAAVSGLPWVRGRLEAAQDLRRRP
jgi:hypothetical protein